MNAAHLREIVWRNSRMMWSEIDTQARLVEPVLAALSWDLDDLAEVRRTKRAGHTLKAPKSFDVELGPSQALVAAIEVKACGSTEVLLDRCAATQGRLTLTSEIKGAIRLVNATLGSGGAPAANSTPRKMRRPRDTSTRPWYAPGSPGQLKSCRGDGFAQLRIDCCDRLLWHQYYEGESRDAAAARYQKTRAVLTDGMVWVVFKPGALFDESNCGQRIEPESAEVVTTILDAEMVEKLRLVLERRR